MSTDSPTPRRNPRAVLLGAGVLAAALGGGLRLARWTSAAPAEVLASSPPQTAPVAVVEPDVAPAEPAAQAPSAEPAEPAPGAALEEWIAGLARELVHQPYQPRTFRERLAGCLGAWTPGLQQSLESALQAPPASDPEFVALASLASARSLQLAASLATRLRPLALRDDLPFGVAVEAARALVVAGGTGELGWWCALLEQARDARTRSIAAGALEALHECEGERFVMERALELRDPRAAARLLDALARALEATRQPWENPARGAAAERLSWVAGDRLADAGLRARALGVLRAYDPEAAARVASDWFLEPGAGSERIESAASSLHGQAAAALVLQSAQADPRIDDSRRVRLAECVLFTRPESLSPELREQSLSQMRTALRESSDGAARRRALHALARFGTEADQLLVQQAAEGDADLLARAAARSARMREASDWR